MYDQATFPFGRNRGQAIDHEVCGVATDHLLAAFTEVCGRYRIGDETELVVAPARADPWRVAAGEVA